AVDTGRARSATFATVATTIEAVIAPAGGAPIAMAINPVAQVMAKIQDRRPADGTRPEGDSTSTRSTSSSGLPSSDWVRLTSGAERMTRRRSSGVVTGTAASTTWPTLGPGDRSHRPGGTTAWPRRE